MEIDLIAKALQEAVNGAHFHIENLKVADFIRDDLSRNLESITAFGTVYGDSSLVCCRRVDDIYLKLKLTAQVKWDCSNDDIAFSDGDICACDLHQTDVCLSVCDFEGNEVFNSINDDTKAFQGRVSWICFKDIVNHKEHECLERFSEQCKSLYNTACLLIA